MNRTKMLHRLVALCMALLLLLSMSIPAMATDITINGTGKVYIGYRLLDLTTSLKRDHVDHPDSPEHSPECWNYAYTVNNTYRTSLISALGVESPAKDTDIVAAIRSKSPEELRDFADDYYKTTLKTLSPDATAADKSFTDVAQGYWLIVEKEKASASDAISLVMLDTAGQDDITVDAKEGTPTLKLKVEEVNDSTCDVKWQDAADMDGGDTVRVKMTGTIPANIKNFPGYEYIFHITYSGTESVADYQSTEIKIGDTVLSADKYTVTAFGDSVTVKINDILGLVNDGTLETTDAIDVVCTFKGGTKDHYNENSYDEFTANIDFTASPYETVGESNRSSTPNDIVKVFYYALDVSKVDGASAALPGAKFTLFKRDASNEWQTVKVHEAETGKTEFRFAGLDSGIYKLEETEAPAGYNKADDLLFEVRGAYTTDSVDPQFSELVVYDLDGNRISAINDENAVFNISDRLMSTKVINNTGLRLPITGGAGVYVIYIAAAALIIVGCVVLVVRKHKKGQEV